MLSKKTLQITELLCACQIKFNKANLEFVNIRIKMLKSTAYV